MEYYKAIKKNEILPFAAAWMGLEGIMLMWNKSDKQKQILYDIHMKFIFIYDIHKWNLKNITN